MEISDNPPADEDVWHGICPSSTGDTAQIRTLGSVVHKPPTGAEVTAIKAAQDLFMSSAFKLQVCLVVRFYVSVAPMLRSPAG